MQAIDCFASPELRQGLKGSIVLPQILSASSNGSKNSTKSQKSIMVGEGIMAVRGFIMGVEEKKARLGEGITFDSLPPDTYINQDCLSIAKSPPSRIAGKMFGAHKGNVRALLQAMENEINKSQKIAIEAAFNQRATLWQGPPGTGKTRTLVRFITAFCLSKQGQVLACADSNVAVDNLLEGLLDQGLRVVQVCQPVKMKEMLRDATLDAQLSKHPLMLKAAESKQAAVLQTRTGRIWKCRLKLVVHLYKALIGAPEAAQRRTLQPLILNLCTSKHASTQFSILHILHISSPNGAYDHSSLT